MSMPKKPTHVVIHPSFYLRVNGKLQEMEVGTTMSLSKEAGESMVKKGFVKNLKDAKTVEVGEDEK